MLQMHMKLQDKSGMFPVGTDISADSFAYKSAFLIH
jgi:hypothetical protein